MTRTIIALLLALTVPAFAGPSKEECVDAHGKGQDAKEAGKLSLARKLFLTCAQTSCPSLVQGDCARFADELSRMQPSISLVARDSNGADLPDTTVYVDDVLMVTRLDDGKPHEIDPVDALSAENKSILEAAAAEAHVVMLARYDARNPAALKTLVSGGTKLRAFSNDLMENAFKHSMDLYAEISAKNPDWKKIYADYDKFRADQNLWFRFTEATFDRFMQAQKL